MILSAGIMAMIAASQWQSQSQHREIVWQIKTTIADFNAIPNGNACTFRAAGGPPP
jgi:hypothetical protein